MSMKNQKTMYALAKAKAIEEGPKTFRMLSGYALTEAEIRRMYAVEGFTKPATIDRHLAIWKDVEWVDVQPVGPNRENIFFFTLDDSTSEERERHMSLRSKHPDCTESLPGVFYA